MTDETGRVYALDGLRGVAALIVVIHHSLLSSAGLISAYRHPGIHLTGLDQALTYTPLHLVWDGGEAVFLFFVLSGFVLFLPFEKKHKEWQAWAAYYPRRVLRLALPIWGSLVVTTVAVLLVKRHADLPSDWVDSHAAPFRLGALARDVSVLWGGNYLNSALWSMRWEMLFSLLLPAFIFYATFWRRTWMAKVVVALLLIALGAFLGNPYIEYLPMFAAGCALASARVHVLSTIERAPKWIHGPVFVISLLMVNAAWTTATIAGDARLHAGATAVSVLGATLLLVLALSPGAINTALSSRLPSWLGRISFSLYLVHEPIVVSVAQIRGADPGEILVLSLVTALPIAVLFYYIVEMPAHRLSQLAGRLVTTRINARESAFTAAS